MKIGSIEHRNLFCRWFVETHVVFEPEALPWPDLQGELLDRLRSFPFWSYARTIERRAGLMVSAFAETIEDPVIRGAIALQGYEETRHARLMQHVLDRYAIEAVELDLPPAPPTRESFLVFGFGECRDSFLGFGAFALAEQAQYFPPALLAIFERVLLEEARHITFFVNWFRYEEVIAGHGGFVRRALTEARALLDATLQTTFNDRPQESVAPGAGSPEDLEKFFPGLTPARFLEIALDSNRRFMRFADPRLAKPKLTPALARALLYGIRLLPPRAPTPKLTSPAVLRSVG